MSNDQQALSVEEQMALMQQQLQQQQQLIIQLLQQQQEHSTQPQPQSSQFMDTSDAIHSIPSRPKYDWTPSAELIDLFELHRDLFCGTPWDDRTRTNLIDMYPPIKDLDYRPPDSVPELYQAMNEQQKPRMLLLSRFSICSQQLLDLLTSWLMNYLLKIIYLMF